MVFSTIIFLFRFLPIPLALYYLAPAKLKNTVLFLCSLVFYCWGEVRFFPVMVALILINYISGLCIEHFDQKPALRRTFLLVALIGSLGMLFYFKYANFVLRSANALLGTAFAEIQGIGTLPLGISFYTFQTLSYSIDVYRRDVKAERNIIDFGAYVVMFPQLIAGPIVKYRDVSNQLHVYRHRYSLQQIEEGMTLFTFGLAKKVLLADAIGALWTDIIGVANSPSTTFVGLANASTPLVWLGIIAYSLQLYFDFSGYSMMGIGMGKMLGFDFPANFNYPYISASITEFWRRWHMTLSGWFREYVYIPLGGNRKGLKRQIFNLFVVELLTGIWHGANWNFICWGLYYFVLLAVEKLFLLPHLQKGRVWPHIYTLFLVVVGWAMFVGNDTGVSFGLLFHKLFVPSGGVSPLYFLRNYGVLLVVSILCCTPFIEKIWNLLKKNAADLIGTVGKILQRDTGAGGKLLCHGHAHAVAGILLAGVHLDHNALVHVGAVVHIGVFRVVGVHGVGVVGAEHEAGRHRTVEVLIAGADVLRDAVQYIVQEGGSRALLGAGTHFFVVEEGGNVDGAGAVRVQKTLQDAEHALLVIQTAGGDELLIAAPDGGLFADAEEQVAAKDLVFCDLQLGGDQLFQHAFLGGTAQQGQHIHLLVVGSLVVDLAVHMDGHAGDHQQVAVQREQAGSDGIVLLYQHTACHRQRPGCRCAPTAGGTRHGTGRHGSPVRAGWPQADGPSRSCLPCLPRPRTAPSAPAR